MEFRQVQSDSNFEGSPYFSIIISDIEIEDDMDKFFMWCRDNFNYSDVYIFEIKKKILHRFKRGNDYGPGKSEYMPQWKTEICYQMSYISEKDLLMFQLKWADFITDKEVQNELVKKL